MIFYAAVANGQIILAQYNATIDPFSDVAEKVLASISHLRGEKLKNSFNAEELVISCSITSKTDLVTIKFSHCSLSCPHEGNTELTTYP